MHSAEISYFRAVSFHFFLVVPLFCRPYFVVLAFFHPTFDVGLPGDAGLFVGPFARFNNVEPAFKFRCA